MTYASYLLIFLVLPLLVLAILHLRRRSPGRLAAATLLLHVVVALIYTTPWDNYLVANKVWSYDPARVIGIVLGWVPIEEYAFFVLQTLMTGLWLLYVWHPQPDAPPWRWQPWRPGLLCSALTGLVWLAAAAVWGAGRQRGAYLALELGWFLPPIILQLAVGAEILWRQRRLVALALLPPIVYLPASDSVAIAAGIWTISPLHTLGIRLAGILPLEEIIFFTLTNILIVFGMVLLLWAQSQAARHARGTDGSQDV